MSKFTLTVTGSTIGAQALGDGASATGHVSLGRTMPSQEEHRANVKAAQKALVDDEEALGPLLHEVLGQFLRIAREIQVGQEGMSKIQLAMKDTLEEVWAQHTAAALSPVPQSVKFLGELAKNPLMSEVVKRLAGG
jgi:hypothetical protein